MLTKNPLIPTRLHMRILEAPNVSPVCAIVNEDPDVVIFIDDALLVISPDVAIEVLVNPPVCEIEAEVDTPFL